MGWQRTKGEAGVVLHPDRAGVIPLGNVHHTRLCGNLRRPARAKSDMIPGSSCAAGHCTSPPSLACHNGVKLTVRNGIFHR